MGTKFENVDLVRLSQRALPIARDYDKDKNGTLDKSEYTNFMQEWNKKHKNQSPLLMQLHTKTLTPQALELAKKCDIDNYKGVLTENELKKFMDLCDKKKLTKIFKSGTSVKTILTGESETEAASKTVYKDKKSNLLNEVNVRSTLLKNWMKLDLMSFKGSDKFFHAVGNYEAMMSGSETIVKEVCAGQDDDKRKNTKRAEADFTEDLYANWLGRELYKMYPDKCPQELFKALAPTGFNIEKSKQSVYKIGREQNKEKENWLSKKYDQYSEYFKQDYIRKRIKEEILGIF